MPQRTTTSPARRALINLGKLALAGSTICAVALGMVVMGPKGEVKESKADIADAFFVPVSNTQRFAAALDKLGHEPPRVYNYNGNDIYFSVAVSPKRPDELVRDYQEEFVRQGINERVYNSAHVLNIHKMAAQDKDQDEAIEAMLSGQIIPDYIARDKVTMQGALIKGTPRTKQQFREQMFAKTIPTTKEHFADIFQSFRGIEAEWDEEAHQSVITATWGDEDFDMRKTMRVSDGGATEDVATDPEIPVCPGCERLTRFAGASADEDQIAHVFATDTHPNTVLAFYERALATRGWTETESSSLTRKMKDFAKLQGDPTNNRQFTKDGKFLTLNVSFNNNFNKTYVSLNNSN